MGGDGGEGITNANENGLANGPSTGGAGGSATGAGSVGGDGGGACVQAGYAGGPGGVSSGIMKTRAFLAALVALSALPAIAEDGFTPLFDGKTMQILTPTLTAV